MRIGFIGLGAMGRPMAANLQRAGHELAVHDQRPGAADELVAHGADRAATPAQVAAVAQVLFTSLPGPAEVEAVALGAHGVLGALRPDAAWFDLTTNAPECVRRLHARLASQGSHFLDAPVSGGPRGAQSGKLALWVGGERDIYARHEPVLRAIGDQPCYVGPIGAGSIAKLAHNCASFSIQTALAEVMTLGVKAGVEPAALFGAIRQGATGRARTFDRLIEQFLTGQYDPAAFALRLAHKDLTLALELARSHGVPLRVAELAHAEFAEAMRRGWGERDCRVSMALQEERAGVAVRIAPEVLRTIAG